MKKIYFFSFFSSSLFYKLIAQEKTNHKFSTGCNNEISENYFLNADNLNIKKIEIDVNNYRKWTVNNIKILTTRSRFIPTNLKLNFNGK